MTLKRITLRNFQTHRKIVVDLDPHVTTIIGSTDAGKSSILRAIGLVCLNQPTGGRFVKDGSDHYTISLETDQHIIIRRRGDKRNIYKLDGKTLRAFGAGGVPRPVELALNVDGTNFQWQLDAPFWLLESPGQVAKNLNEIVNLDIIDRTMQNIATALRAAKAEVSSSETRLAQLKERKQQLSWVKEVDRRLKEVEEAERRHDGLKEKQQRLEILTKQAQQHYNLKTRLDEALPALRNVKEWAGKARSAHKRAEVLARLLTDIAGVRKLARLKLPDFDRLTQVRAEADAIAQNRMRLEQLIDEIKKAKEDKCEAKTELANLNELMKQKTEGNCPLCGQEFDPSQCSHQTGTSPTGLPSPVRRNRIGMRSKKDTSTNSSK